jgi:hypothetical protein
MKESQQKNLEDISKKLNILISLSLRSLLQDSDFSSKRKRGTGDLANYLADFGISPKDIAEILGAPIQSIRTFLTPTRRRK